MTEIIHFLLSNFTLTFFLVGLIATAVSLCRQKRSWIRGDCRGGYSCEATKALARIFHEQCAPEGRSRPAAAWGPRINAKNGGERVIL